MEPKRETELSAFIVVIYLMLDLVSLLGELKISNCSVLGMDAFSRLYFRILRTCLFLPFNIYFPHTYSTIFHGPICIYAADTSIPKYLDIPSLLLRPGITSGRALGTRDQTQASHVQSKCPTPLHYHSTPSPFFFNTTSFVLQNNSHS